MEGPSSYRTRVSKTAGLRATQLKDWVFYSMEEMKDWKKNLDLNFILFESVRIIVNSLLKQLPN